MKGPASRPGQESGRGSSDSPAVTELSLLWGAPCPGLGADPVLE